MAPAPRACFVHASEQNVYFGEILDAFRAALEQTGVATQQAVDHFPAPEPGLVYVFVPHEFIPLTYPNAHPTAEHLRRTVAIGTEQPGTAWFEEVKSIAQREGVITLDINRLGVAEFRRHGIDARFLQLGYVPEWDRWHGDTDSDRPIDLTFLGGYSPRRAALIAQCARHLRTKRAAIHLAETWTPHTKRTQSFLYGPRKWDLLRDSKLMLNVHRSENAYLEWARMIEAAANGCVFVTEHSSGYEPLVPGEHFVTGTLSSLSFLVAGLLNDPDWIADVRDKAYRLLTEKLTIARSVAVLADAVRELAGVPLRDGAAYATSAKPRAPEKPTPEWIRLERASNEIEVVRMGLKKVLLDQRELKRRMSGLEDRDKERREDSVTVFGPQERTPPKVSVAVTLFNYENVIEEALHNAALSDFEPFEIVVVDDASTDGSREAAHRALAARPWVSSKVVARGENGGLAAARNTAVEHSRGEYVFILDADNGLYPHALARLAAALDEDSTAAFAYAPIEKYTSDGPVDLLSWRSWDPERLKYGNYIDAMAMLRRSAFEQAGGYESDPRLWGWEDFDLWCTFADHGFHGVYVPEVLTRYRSGRHSMISLTNISGTEAWGLLLERHPIFRS